MGSCKVLLHTFAATFAMGSLVATASVAAAESAELPPGALVCKKVELAAEHARIIADTPTAGLSDRLRAFIDPHVASGDCLQIKAETTASVADVDLRGPGFTLVSIAGQSGTWWTHAENIWGYFDAPIKLKAWKKN